VNDVAQVALFERVEAVTSIITVNPGVAPLMS
jgi:hypothetical protein